MIRLIFGDVITHELGHVLGYSSSIPDLLQTAYGSLVDEVDGTFIGEHATAVNGGPVSLQGGSLSHLDRSSFPSSIMSPVALRGGNLDISRLELAILADIGLPINIDFSDETLPMVTVEEITTDEDKNIANITVNLNKNSVKPVSIDYTTIDFGYRYPNLSRVAH